MSSNYLKLNEPPRICMQYPTCSACCVDLDHDGDGWTCPSCGTIWDTNADEDAEGELYADWSGEEPEGPEADVDQAWLWGVYLTALRRHRLFPNAYPTAPRRPTESELKREEQ